MSLAFSRERTTRDVDARIDAGHYRLTEAVRTVGRRHGLADTWLNDQATTAIPRAADARAVGQFLAWCEARGFLEAIDTGTLAGLRDRALVSVMLYSFARVSAVISMRRQDYFRQGLRGVAASARERRHAARRACRPTTGLRRPSRRISPPAASRTRRRPCFRASTGRAA